MTIVWILIAVAALLLLGAIFYWAFIVTEGAYLGAKTVAWTYDITARRYDGIKQFDAPSDTLILALPMLRRLHTVDCPLILDIATGTARLPLSLLNRPLFRGQIVGLDLSRKMLQEAETKLEIHRGRYTFVWRDAQHLPFPDETFDAVSCLEALEFMPSPRRVLGEMSRVLRPGGIFLGTNRVNWERKLMPGKAFTDGELYKMLTDVGLVDVGSHTWQVYYDLIWAKKGGEQLRLGRGTQEIEQFLRCPHCQHISLVRAGTNFICSSCEYVYPFADNIIDMHKR